MAFTAVAAMVTGGGAAAIGISAFTAMTYVGIAMTVIGAVTGDKQLMKTGGMLGLIGGAGGALTADGGLLAGGTAGEATAADAMTGMSAEQGAAIGAGGGGGAAAGAAGEAAGASLSGSSAVDAGLQAGGAGTELAGASAGLPGEAAAGAASGAAPLQTQVIDPAGMSQTASAGVTAPAGAISPSEAMQFNMNGATDFMGVAAKTDSNSFFSGVGKVWDGLGPQGKAAGIQLVGGAFSGAAETERHNDLMDYRNRELALRSHGSAVAKYKPSGIINSTKA